MGKLINSSVYSLIKEEYSGRNISDAFIYLTKAVIKAREYRPFSVQDMLCKRNMMRCQQK